MLDVLVDLWLTTKKISVQTHMHESLKKLDIPYLLIDASQNIELIHIKIAQSIQERL